MIQYISLAWRNIWRNKKRTLITAGSIFFAVILALFMRSMQFGSYAHMINNIVKIYTGHIQIHSKGYWEEKTLNNSFEYNESFKSVMSSINEKIITVPRIETFALMSSGNSTKGAIIIGIDPISENKMTELEKRIISGNFLSQYDTGILLSEGLAKYLNKGVSEEIILLGQGYHGVTAAGKYHITGILKFPTPDLNNQFAFLTLSEVQKLYLMENRITSLAILVDDNKMTDLLINELNSKLPANEYEIISWRKMMPEIVQSIEMDNAGGIIMLGILYIIIGFGIFGTVVMMTYERTHEFGILISIGMKPVHLAKVLCFETIFISFLGVLAGLVVGIPLLIFMYYHPITVTGKAAAAMLKFGQEPIMPFSLDPGIFFSQIKVILVIALISMIYPITRILKLNIIKAIRT